MAKSMIGLDPLAWLSPTGATPKKKSKSKSASAKKKVTKKKATKKKIAKKKVSAKNKSVTKKKVIAKKKNADKKKISVKSKAISKKKVSKKSVAKKGNASPKTKRPIKQEQPLNTNSEIMFSSYQDVIVDVTEELPSNDTVDEIQAVELKEQEIESEIKQVKSEETPVSDSTIKLGEVQDISQVAELHQKVATILNSQDIFFDGSDVERIDASTLQLITCAFKQADKYGNKVSWQGSSDALKKSASLLGLTEILNL